MEPVQMSGKQGQREKESKFLLGFRELSRISNMSHNSHNTDILDSAYRNTKATLSE